MLQLIFKLFLLVLIDHIQSLGEILVTVNSSSSLSQDHPDTVGLKSGNFLITYEGFDSSLSTLTTSDIWARIFNPNGSPLTGVFKVNSQSGTNNYGVQACAMSGGGFVTVWANEINANSMNAYIRFFYDNGAAITNEIQLNTQTAPNPIRPKVACSYSGVVAIWHETNGGGNEIFMMNSQFDDSGNSISNPQKYNLQSSKSKLVYPIITALQNYYLFTWMENDLSSSNCVIYALLYTFNMSPYKSSFQVNTNSSKIETDLIDNTPSVVLLDNGGFVITWYSYNTNTDYDIIAQVYDSNGVTIGGNIIVNTYLSNWQGQQTISTAPGGFLIIWESYEQNGPAHSLHGQYFDNSGNKIRNEFLLNLNTTKDQLYPSANRLTNGRIVVAWRTYDFLNSGNGFDLIFRILPLPICSNLNLFFSPGKAIPLNFTGCISDSFDCFSKLNIILKTLPMNGVINVNNVNVTNSPAVIDVPYANSDLTFNSTTLSSVTYQVVNQVQQQSSTCTITFTVGNCYKSCAQCGGNIGDASDNKCAVCADTYYPLSSKPSQCYSQYAIIQGHYFNTTYQEFLECNSNCLYCRNGSTCGQCQSGYYLNHFGQCVTSCSSGYYQNNNAKQCLKCVDNCDICSNSCQCSRCNNGYYVDYLTKQCVSACPIGYRGDPTTGNCEPCYQSCATCLGHGNFTNNNCLSCKSSYYSISDNPSMCVSDPPQYYYLNNTLSQFRPCYYSCNTCISDGDSSNHMCRTCKSGCFPMKDLPTSCYSKTPSGYYFEPYSSEYIKCPGAKNNIISPPSIIKITDLSPSLFYKDEVPSIQLSLSEALGNSDLYTVITSAYLTSNVRQYTKYPLNIEYPHCFNLIVKANSALPESRYNITIVDGYNNHITSSTQIYIFSNDTNSYFNSVHISSSFNQLTSQYLKNEVSKFGEVEDYKLFTNANSTIQIVKINNASLLSAEEDNKRLNLSKVLFSSCEHILREKYNIPANEGLVYAKMDNKNNNSVSFQMFDSEGNRLNLSLCDGCSKIAVQMPIKLSHNESYIKEMQKQGVDIYNASDPFYNNICFEYSNSKSDMTLNDRRENIFPNVTYKCSKGCKYNSLDLANFYVNCLCQPSQVENVSHSTETDILNKISKNNLQVVTCYNVFTSPKKLFLNLGFYCSLALTGSLVLGVSWSAFIHKPLNAFKLDEFVYNDCTVLKKEEHCNLKKGDKENSVVTVGKIPANPPKKVSQISKTNRNRLKTKNNTTNTIGKNVIKGNPPLTIFQRSIKRQNKETLINNYMEMATNDIKVEVKHPGNPKIEIDIQENNFIRPEQDKILNTEFNKETNFNKLFEIKTNKNNDLSPSSRINLLNTKLKKKQSLVREECHIIDYTHKDYEKMEFSELIEVDKRSLLNYYWESITSHHCIFFVYYQQSLLYPFHIRLYHLIFILFMDISINVIFFSDQYISARYYTKKTLNFSYTLTQETIRVLYSTLISCILCSFVSLLFQPLQKAEEELNKAYQSGDLSTIQDAYKEYLKKMRWRYFIYYTITIILIIFFTYFITCFCGIFTRSQYGWLQGGLISVFIRVIIIEIFVPLLRAINRSLAFKLHSRCLYKYNIVVNILSFLF